MNGSCRSLLFSLVVTVVIVGCGGAPGESPSGSIEDFGHFDPKGKPPSEHTLRVLQETSANLPFADTSGSWLEPLPWTPPALLTTLVLGLAALVAGTTMASASAATPMAIAVLRTLAACSGRSSHRAYPPY